MPDAARPPPRCPFCGDLLSPRAARCARCRAWLRLAAVRDTGGNPEVDREAVGRALAGHRRRMASGPAVLQLVVALGEFNLGRFRAGLAELERYAVRRPAARVELERLRGVARRSSGARSVRPAAGRPVREGPARGAEARPTAAGGTPPRSRTPLPGARPGAEPSAAEGRAPGPTALVIDPRPVVRRLVREALTRRGWAVRTLPGLEGAAGRLRATHPDVVLLGPDAAGDAYGLCAGLRALPEAGHVSVVLLAPAGVAPDPIRARRLGVSSHVATPFDPGELDRTARGARGNP